MKLNQDSGKMLTLVKGRARGTAPEALQATIAAAEEEAKQARREAERLVAAAGEELDDDKAEAMLAESRAQDRAARRAEAKIPELREKLAEAQWQARERAFERYRREIAGAGRKAIDALEKAAEANAGLAKLKQSAAAELGAHASALPNLMYGGILMPDLVASWRRLAERALDGLDKVQLERPALPAAANDPRPGPIYPRPGPVAIARGEILSNRVEPMPAAPAAPAAEESPGSVPAPAPAPQPAPRREPRRDGPPGTGERQLHFLAGGGHSLPDGSLAGAGDYVNLPAEDAQKFVERGVANFVDLPAPVVDKAAVGAG